MHRLLMTVGSLLVVFGLWLPARAAGFADAAFERLWRQTDAAVAAGHASRSWLWGPEALTPGLREAYAEAPGGTRLVQYFDKARMEINHPGANRNDLWYVTNGLLPIELISGRLQLGDARFEQRAPAQIAALGDPDNAFPTYADLGRLLSYQDIDVRPGVPITAFLNRDSALSFYDAYRHDPQTQVAVVENGRGIPNAFLRYMTEVSAPLPRLFTFGQPISGAAWTRVRVKGVERAVMFQVFERRVLTYTPDNPPAFRVEAGNVGQHYYRWRYGADWIRQQFGTAWNIAYPADWTINDAGIHEGALELRGVYEGRSYRINLCYPIGITAPTLEAWIAGELAGLSPEQRAQVRQSALTVAGAPARKVLNIATPVGPVHRVYVWRAGTTNPRLIEIVQTDGAPPDPSAAERLLDRFVADIRP
ncbi:hypothetical protein [Kallotenue papyrolyticum]|uniref:hypothetical protein n=1 Tax=Kallotenue papyrolyticum TaxID=1325125 RepID=UPI000492406F|nr:hypothetical protein [Kallotenue papyrolyticum]